MEIHQQDLSETYRNLSDTEIASLHAQIDTLTKDARAALTSEIQRRGMSDAHLSKLHASELRQEAKFDQRQSEHRKGVASILLRGDPFWTIVVIVTVLGAAALFSLAASHH